MNKRVHEIAKERGLPARDVLEKLRAAGVNVKAASSSVDEAVAIKALGNGDTRAQENQSPAQAAKAAQAARPATRPARDPRSAASDRARGKPPPVPPTPKAPPPTPT